MARWETDAMRILLEMRNEQPWTTAHFALELSRVHKAATARIAELEAEYAEAHTQWAEDVKIYNARIASLGAEIAALTAKYMPGMTDLTVAPETLDAWLEGNPLPEDPVELTKAHKAAVARIAELEAEVARQATEIEFLNDVGDERHAKVIKLEAEIERVATDDLRKLQLAVSQREAGRSHIAELAAALAICHRDIETLMSSADKLEAKNTELEAERDRLLNFNSVIRAALSGEGVTK
jgi:uncharacterized coiled-coil protein SlyX